MTNSDDFQRGLYGQTPPASGWTGSYAAGLNQRNAPPQAAPSRHVSPSRRYQSPRPNPKPTAADIAAYEQQQARENAKEYAAARKQQEYYASPEGKAVLKAREEIRLKKEEERRVYLLTPAGQAELRTKRRGEIQRAIVRFLLGGLGVIIILGLGLYCFGLPGLLIAPFGVYLLETDFNEVFLHPGFLFAVALFTSSAYTWGPIGSYFALVMGFMICCLFAD